MVHIIIALGYLILNGSIECTTKYLDAKYTDDQILSIIYPKYNKDTKATGRIFRDKKEDWHYGLLLFSRESLKSEIVEFSKSIEPEFLKGYILMLELLRGDYKSGWYDAYFSILKKTPKGLKLACRHKIALDFESVGLSIYENFGYHLLDFDLANYKINSKERAFGYRYTKAHCLYNFNQENQKLVLFRFNPNNIENDIEKIFEEQVLYNLWEGEYPSENIKQTELITGKDCQTDQEPEIVTTNHLTCKSQLFVSKEKTNNNYNWILQVNSQKLLEPEINKKYKNKKYKKESLKHIFVWDGTKYVRQKNR